MISSDKSRASGRGIVTNGEGMAYAGHLNLTKSMADVLARQDEISAKRSAAAKKGAAASVAARRKRFVEQCQRQAAEAASRLPYAGYDASERY